MGIKVLVKKPKNFIYYPLLRNMHFNNTKLPPVLLGNICSKMTK